MISDSKTFTLIDFGMCERYLDSAGNHIKESETVPEFRGNLTFASVGQLEFRKSSPKDDLMSLGYLIVYLLNNSQMPFKFNQMFPMNEKVSQFEELVKCRVYKK